MKNLQLKAFETRQIDLYTLTLTPVPAHYRWALLTDVFLHHISGHSRTGKARGSWRDTLIESLNFRFPTWTSYVFSETILQLAKSRRHIYFNYRFQTGISVFRISNFELRSTEIEPVFGTRPSHGWRTPANNAKQLISSERFHIPSIKNNPSTT